MFSLDVQTCDVGCCVEGRGEGGGRRALMGCCTQHESLSVLCRGGGRRGPYDGCCMQHAHNMAPEHFFDVIKVYFECCKDSSSML
jgi:hypothetical protein